MIEIIYLLFFSTFSVLYIFIKSSREGELSYYQNFSMNIQNEYLIVLKIIPALLTIIFALLIRNPKFESDLYLGIIIALIFCLIGDIAIEYNLINGIIMFSIAHIFFILTFFSGYWIHFYHLDFIPVMFLSIMVFLIIIYNSLFINFLKGGGKLGKLTAPITIYTMLISTMFTLAFSVVYFMRLDQLAIVIPIGALFFIISDSLIAIREFHTKDIKYSVAKIMGTYYIAIFLLSFTSAYL